MVIPGLNHPKNVDLSGVPGLLFYEERMLFFMFLLKYSRTKIVYVASAGFNEKLFDYYIRLVSTSDEDFAEKKDRLTYISINDSTNDALTRKILKNEKFSDKIKRYISDPKKTVLRCYNPTEVERKLAVKLGVPLFGSKEKFDFVGTKSGGRQIFKLAKTNLLPGYNNIKNFKELAIDMIKLAQKNPKLEKMMIKRNYSSSGKGNCLFFWQKFIDENNTNLKNTSAEVVAKLILKKFDEYCSFQNVNATYPEYKKRFNDSGGIVEAYAEGDIVFSPSTQILITNQKKGVVASTHEQILGGPDKQVYLGCTFPSKASHRKLIIKEGEKIANCLAQKGVVGNFAIDYVVTYDKEMNNPVVYPIEINLRKGGTTHPFRIAFYLTGAKYNHKTGMLQYGNTPVYYLAMEFIESPKYVGLDPMELINIVANSKISFNRNTKKGALVYMPGMIHDYGRFGAICIGQSEENAEMYYKKLLRLVNNYVKSLSNNYS